jgi:tRNA-splicing ligase RtcB
VGYFETKDKYRAWLPPEKIEAAALAQINALIQLPGLFQWAAIMPDVHPGFGMPIGGVAAFVDKACPNAVGVDIGCGVMAVKTNLEAAKIRSKLASIIQSLLSAIPVGFAKRNQPLPSSLWQRVPQEKILIREMKNARLQLGTLGGGNHFIEVQEDPQGAIWLMLHSGSRNLGKQVADYYNRQAKDWCLQEGQPFPTALAWLPTDSPKGRDYLVAMDFCLNFAAENRRQMADIALATLNKFFAVDRIETVETVHNFAAWETHFSHRVLVHRKGAVPARGLVVIPGSMGTYSYIGQGLANPASFASCSHGAGRVLGRSEAKRLLNRKQVLAELKEKSIILLSPDRDSVVEEASAAYKDLDEVMDYQRDLVTPLVKLRPLAVLKG